MTSEAVYTLSRWDEVASVTTVRGSIGAGKSTVMSEIERYLAENDLLATSPTATAENLFLMLPEPVNDWCEAKYNRQESVDMERDAMSQSGESQSSGEKESIFEKMCRDKRRYGFSFQVKAFTTRMAALRVALSAVPRRQRRVRIHLIPERFMADDRLFFENLYESGYVEQWDWDIYHDFYNEQTPDLNRKETAMVYVPTEPAVCLRRLTQRDRVGETDGGVPLVYLQELEKKHEALVKTYTGRVWQMDSFRGPLTAHEIREQCIALTKEIIAHAQ